MPQDLAGILSAPLRGSSSDPASVRAGHWETCRGTWRSSRTQLVLFLVLLGGELHGEEDTTSCFVIQLFGPLSHTLSLIGSLCNSCTLTTVPGPLKVDISATGGDVPQLTYCCPSKEGCFCLGCFCLGPLLFTIYASKLFQILKHHLPSVHTYAEDTQLYLSFKPSDSSSEVEAVSGMQKCICDVRPWMREDHLMLNNDKTELFIDYTGTLRQLSKISIQSIKIGQTEVSPVASARNLVTWFDTHLDMGNHTT